MQPGSPHSSSDLPVPAECVCRLCGFAWNHGERLVLDPAPAAAQYFLDAADENARDFITLTIVQCPGCGLVQSVSPVVKYYRSVITAAGFSPAMREHRLKRARFFSEAYHLEEKPVVEIGCHDGYFLEILGAIGLNPHGTEYGESASKYPVSHVYPAPGTVIEGGPFAAFFCLNFLEHAPDPRGFLLGIRENLTFDGVGLIEVPNYAQQRRAGRVFDYIADHLSYFDAETLATTLSLSGFTVERIEETRGGENLEAWVRRRRDVSFARETEGMRDVQDRLRQWLAQQKQKGKRIAVWGASHQALTLLACIDPDHVAGIFDSAPFKQGKFAPVTRLPIVRPEPRAFEGIHGVLIIASGYEQEIASTLRRLGFAGEIHQTREGAVVPVD